MRIRSMIYRTVPERLILLMVCTLAAIDRTLLSTTTVETFLKFPDRVEQHQAK
jgi:hypothetical protein